MSDWEKAIDQRRIGQFWIDRELLKKYPQAVADFLGRCLIIRCELLGYSDCFEYVAYSPLFEPHDLPCPPRFYFPRFDFHKKPNSSEQFLIFDGITENRTEAV